MQDVGPQEVVRPGCFAADCELPIWSRHLVRAGRAGRAVQAGRAGRVEVRRRAAGGCLQSAL